MTTKQQYTNQNLQQSVIYMFLHVALATKIIQETCHDSHQQTHLSHSVASGSNITSCNKIDKTLVVCIFSNYSCMGIRYAKLFEATKSMFKSWDSHAVEHGFYLKKPKLGPDLHAWRYTGMCCGRDWSFRRCFRSRKRCTRLYDVVAT